jgi:hypothetical protein
MAAVFCPACCATILSSCRFARWTARTGMPVSDEIARTLRPAASNGATLARLVSWALRSPDANRVVAAVMLYCTADDARSGTHSPTLRWADETDNEEHRHAFLEMAKVWTQLAMHGHEAQAPAIPAVAK